MTARLVLETEDFASAAIGVSRDVVRPMTASTDRLLLALGDAGGCAGSDPGGTSWARAYDRAASTVLGAALDVVNGAMQLAAMFAQSARNYEAAESASTAGGRPVSLTGLPGPGEMCFATTAVSVSGGSDDPPSGWGTVAHLVGWVWPNGHQDRLHELGSAWRAAADALEEPASMAQLEWVQFFAHSLPEAEDMQTVCTALHRHLTALVSAYRSLGQACDSYAHHLDQVHHEVASELRSLAEWTAGIEGAGAVFAFLSFGASEGAAQLAEAAKASATAARIATLIERFTAAARTLADAIPSIEHAALGVRAGLEGLLGSRLAVAGMEGARAVPATSRLARTEMAAADRLAAGSSGLGAISATRSDLAKVRVLLKAARTGRGMYPLGQVTKAQADIAGRAWVGEGARLSRNGKVWMSKDGLRQYRMVFFKKTRQVWEANLESRAVPYGGWPHNGHMLVVDAP